MPKPNEFRITQSQVAQLADQGYFVTPKLFDDALLAKLGDEIMRLRLAQVSDAEARNDPKLEVIRNRTYVTHGHRNSKLLAAFFGHEVFVSLCQTLLGDDVELNWTQAIIKPARKGRTLAWHQDAAYAVTEPLDSGVTCLLAITPMTILNGTISAAPGWHKRGLLPHTPDPVNDELICQFQPQNETPIEMEAGQMLVFGRLLPHRSGPNVTQEDRISLQISYVPAGMVMAQTHEPFGDQVPLLRGGKFVYSLVDH